jgi:hypothetical protein
MNKTPAPTLDQLAAEPEQAASLPSETRAALLARALAVVGALAAPALTGTPTPREDRILDVPEVARRMNVSQDYVYRHAAEWPFTVRRGRKLGFSEVGLIDYIQCRQ